MRNLPILAKLVIAPACLLALMATLAVIVSITIIRTDEALSRLIDSLDRKSRILAEVQRDATALQGEMYRIVGLLGNEASSDNLRDLGLNVEQEISNIRSKLETLPSISRLTAEESKAQGEIIAALDAYSESVHAAVAALDLEMPITVMFIVGVEQSYDRLRQKLSVISQLDRSVNQQIYNDARSDNRSSRRLILVLSVSALFVGGVLTFLSSRMISVPIAAITSAMSKVAHQGTTNLRIPGIDRRDEIGSMAQALEVFKDNALEIKNLLQERQQAQTRLENLNQTLERKVEELRRSEASLARAQRIAHIGNWELEVETDTLFWSAQSYRIFGLESQEFETPVVGLMDMVHPDDRDQVRQTWRRALEERIAYDIVHRIVRPDGTVRVVHQQSEAAYGEDGRPISVTGTIQDITERARAEEEIRKLNEELEERVEVRTAELRAAQDELVRKERLAALGQLTATVSHELRNPLGAMGASVAAIKKLAGDDNRLLGRSVAVLDRSIVRCDNIIGDLLDYSRVRPLDAESVALDDWVETLLDEYAVTPGVELHRELGSGATVALDPDRFHRVMVNLLDNACQAMRGAEGSSGAKGVLNVTTRRIGDRVEVSVGDTGPGIAAADREKIFEPLFSTKSFGVGLGLPIVKRIVKQHDGGIAVESAPDRGTRFVMTLPVKEPMESVA